MTDPERIEEKRVNRRGLISFGKLFTLLLELFYNLGIKRIEALHNTYVLEVERVVRYLTAIQNNTDLIAVGCDDFCFHEAKRGLQDLIKGTCRVRVVRV